MLCNPRLFLLQMTNRGLQNAIITCGLRDLSSRFEKGLAASRISLDIACDVALWLLHRRVRFGQFSFTC